MPVGLACIRRENIDQRRGLGLKGLELNAILLNFNFIKYNLFDSPEL